MQPQSQVMLTIRKPSLASKDVHFATGRFPTPPSNQTRRKSNDMNPNPIRRSPSPLAPPQQPAQFIYATPSPTTTSPYAVSQLTGNSPFMATTNGGSDVTAGADGRPLYLCQPFIRAALVTGKFKNIVVLPKYVDVNEWVAINSMFLLDARSFFPLRLGLTSGYLNAVLFFFFFRACSVRFLHQLEPLPKRLFRMLHASFMSNYVGWSWVSSAFPFQLSCPWGEPE